MTRPGTAFEVMVVRAPGKVCAGNGAPSHSLAERFPIVVVAVEPDTDGSRAIAEPLRPATYLSVLIDGTSLDFTRVHALRLEKAILTALRTAMAAGRP